MNALTAWATANPTAVTIAVVALLALLTWGTIRAVRAARQALTGTPVAVVVAAIAAAACTAYSADTSWRFAAHHLDMDSSAERAAMFAAAELALFSVALMARQNLRTTGAPGVPGLLVWVITGVQIIPAYAESGIVGGTVRAFVGPILAALLWHQAMGIELRHTKPGSLSSGLPATIARELRERLLSWLGLATRDRTAAQITRDRWTRRAVTLAARLADTKPGSRRARRIARRLSVAVGHAQVGAEPEQRRTLLNLLAARRHAAALATVALPSPWQPATVTPVAPAIEAAAGDTEHDAEPDSGDTSTPPPPVTYDSPVDRAIRPLYDTGVRPTTGQMTAAMAAAGLQPTGSTARQSRARIERTERHLAELPSALHRPTGS